MPVDSASNLVTDTSLINNPADIVTVLGLDGGGGEENYEDINVIECRFIRTLSSLT